MNKKIVFFLILVILSAVSIAMLGAGLLSFCMDPVPVAVKLTVCALVLLALSGSGAILLRPQNEQDRKAGMREGFAIVGLSWLAATLIGLIPYMLTCGMSFSDAFFETAFGLSKNEISSPIVLGSNIVVLKYLDEVSGEPVDEFTYMYYSTMMDNYEVQNATVYSDKVENNVLEVYFDQLLSNMSTDE